MSLKLRPNFCSQMIIYFSLNTDFGVGARMVALSSGNGCVLSDSPTLWAFFLRQLQMDSCCAFEGWALAQKRRLKGFFFISKWKCKGIFFLRHRMQLAKVELGQLRSINSLNMPPGLGAFQRWAHSWPSWRKGEVCTKVWNEWIRDRTREKQFNFLTY